MLSSNFAFVALSSLATSPLLSYRVGPFQSCCWKEIHSELFCCRYDHETARDEIEDQAAGAGTQQIRRCIHRAHTLMWDDHRVFRAQWMAWFHADAFCHICFPSMRSYTVRSSFSTFWNYVLKLPRAAFGVQIEATCCQEIDNGTIGYHMIPGRQ